MNPVVAGYFQVLREDLAAARQLAAGVPRASAFHLQQAAEKLVKPQPIDIPLQPGASRARRTDRNWTAMRS